MALTVYLARYEPLNGDAGIVAYLDETLAEILNIGPEPVRRTTSDKLPGKESIIGVIVTPNSEFADYGLMERLFVYGF